MTDQKRHERLEELSNYIDNSIMMCDNEADLIKLASLMMVYSKTILISILRSDEHWRKAFIRFAEKR
jgi:hypothetical protein